MILITGNSGFVGTNLFSYLKLNNYALDGLSLRDSGWQNKSTDANVIVNLVGKAHDHKGEASESDFFRVNCELSEKLFDYFLKSEASLFIHISSIAALEEESHDSIVDEDYRPNPKSAYGRSKRKAEEFLLSKQLPAGKKLVILRPTMIHGPGDKGNLTLLYKIINKGIPYPLGAFNNKRSFLGIDNLCFVIQKLIENKENIATGTYNVSDDECLSTLDIIRTIGVVSEKKPSILKIPKAVIKFLAKTGDVLKLPFNSKRLIKMTSNLVVSNAALKNVIGVEKFPLTAQQGLEKTIKSFNS